MDLERITVVDRLIKNSKSKIPAGKLVYNQKLHGIIEKKRIVVITRDSNLDGVGSVALLLHNYNIKKNNIVFTNYADYGGLPARLLKMRIKNSAVILSDLGISDSESDLAVRFAKLLKSNGNILIWLDHHPWSNETFNKVSEYIDFLVFGESRIYCAAEIVYKLLCRSDGIGDRIATLTHCSDFALRTKYDDIVDRLSYSIIYFGYDQKNKYNSLKRLALLVSNLKLGDPYIKAAHSSYIKGENEAKKKLLDNSYLIGANKCRIGLGFSTRIQTNAACAALMENLNSEIALYVNTKTGKGGVRSKKRDCSKIANALGGGGHPLASGFNLKQSEFNSKARMLKFAQKIEGIANRCYR